MALYNFNIFLFLTLLMTLASLIHCASLSNNKVKQFDTAHILPLHKRDVAKTENQTQTTTPKSTTTTKAPINVAATTTIPNTNCTSNDTNCNMDNDGLLQATYKKIQENKDMLMRTFYVLLGVTGVVVLYFVVKAVRIRRRKSRTRRYGLLAGKGDKMEMTPLDQDDDDEEDITVFEMNGKRR